MSTQLIVGLVAFLVLVGILFLPKHPATPVNDFATNSVSEKVKENDHEGHVHTDDNGINARIDEALKKVESEAPMAGILELRQILVDEPKNVRALMAMGKLSVRSGQYDKAIGRFESVLDVEEENAEAMWELGGIYWEKQQMDSAKYYLKALSDKDLEGYEAAHLFLGRTYLTFADSIGAVNSFEKYLAVAKNVQAADSVKQWLKRLKKQ